MILASIHVEHRPADGLPAGHDFAVVGAAGVFINFLTREQADKIVRGGPVPVLELGIDPGSEWYQDRNARNASAGALARLYDSRL